MLSTRRIGCGLILLLAGACMASGEGDAVDGPAPPEAPLKFADVEPTVVRPGDPLPPAGAAHGRPLLETSVSWDAGEFLATVRHRERTGEKPDQVVVAGWLIQGANTAHRGTVAEAARRRLDPGEEFVLQLPEGELPSAPGEYWLILVVEADGDRYYAEPSRFAVAPYARATVARRAARGLPRPRVTWADGLRWCRGW